MRRKIVTVMPVTAVLAVGLFARPLAVLVAKYLVDDERGDPQPRRRPHRAERHRRSRRGNPTSTLLATESDTTLAFYDVNGTRVSGSGPATPTTANEPPPPRSRTTAARALR